MGESEFKPGQRVRLPYGTAGYTWSGVAVILVRRDDGVMQPYNTDDIIPVAHAPAQPTREERLTALGFEAVPVSPEHAFAHGVPQLPDAAPGQCRHCGHIEEETMREYVAETKVLIERLDKERTERLAARPTGAPGEIVVRLSEADARNARRALRRGGANRDEEYTSLWVLEEAISLALSASKKGGGAVNDEHRHARRAENESYEADMGRAYEADMARMKKEDAIAREAFKAGEAEGRRLSLRLLLEVLPLEYIDGRWTADGSDERAIARAVVTYVDGPSPETGHVGWCWWAQGKMGEAKTARSAMRAAEAALERVADANGEGER